MRYHLGNWFNDLFDDSANHGQTRGVLISGSGVARLKWHMRKEVCRIETIYETGMIHIHMR
jgi:hypothetical protein